MKLSALKKMFKLLHFMKIAVIIVKVTSFFYHVRWFDFHGGFPFVPLTKYHQQERCDC